MQCISEEIYDKFLLAGISVDEVLAEDENEHDEVIFSCISPLDVQDGYNTLVWQLVVRAGSLPYMAQQAAAQLKNFVIKDEASNMEKKFEIFLENHPDSEPKPTKKDILSEVRQHKEFIRKVYETLSDAVELE